MSLLAYLTIFAPATLSYSSPVCSHMLIHLLGTYLLLPASVPLLSWLTCAHPSGLDLMEEVMVSWNTAWRLLWGRRPIYGPIQAPILPPGMHLSPL